MSSPDRPRFLGATRRADGRYDAVWSRRPGERVQVVMLAGAVVSDDLDAVDRLIARDTETLNVARAAGRELA